MASIEQLKELKRIEEEFNKLKARGRRISFIQDFTKSDELLKKLKTKNQKQ